MAEQALVDIRNALIDFVPQQWSTDEALDFASQLDDAFEGSLEDAYEECTKQGAQSLKDCLEDEADDADLSGTFGSTWENAPEEMVNALRRVRTQWNSDARNAIRQVALDANLDTLNRLCANGEYQEVQEELGVDSAPGTFQECVSATSEAQDIRSQLKDAWGTR